LFSELPKIFDRNFVVGFFLPVVVFIAASLGFCYLSGFLSQLVDVLKKDTLLGTTIIGLVTWLGAVVLLIVNRDVYIFFEGYQRFNPLRLMGWLEHRRFRNLQRDIVKVTDQSRPYYSAHLTPPPSIRNRRRDLMSEAAQRFPDEGWVLPTAFGNTIRAFEVYPRVMYGIDDIEGWLRLLAVIPKDYSKLIDDAKAQTDFWVNLRLLSLLYVLEYIAISIYVQRLRMPWLPLLAICVSAFAAFRARKAVVEWGVLVKASYDVFLPSLLKKLQFPQPRSGEHERRLWREFSEAIIYRKAEWMPKRTTQDETVPNVGDVEQMDE